MNDESKTTFRPNAADRALLAKLQRVHGLGPTDVLRMGLRAAEREFEASQFAIQRARNSIISGNRAPKTEAP